MDKQTIIINWCLGFDSSKYDGSIVRNEIVKQLRESVTVITVWVREISHYYPLSAFSYSLHV